MTLDVRELTKRFGDRIALDRVSLTAEPGEICVVCGASGSGKTTLLRLICGLEEIDSGSVELDRQPLNSVPPQRRGIAFVPQDASSLPHLSVAENIAFPLVTHGLARSEAKSRAGQIAERLSIAHLLAQLPENLSAGEKARVALARAWVREPRCILLDEPFAHLDLPLRRELRHDFAKLQRSSNAVTVLVTHHLEEAFSLADRLVILDGGRVLQMGAPLDLYSMPTNPQVALACSPWGATVLHGEFEPSGGEDVSNRDFESEVHSLFRFSVQSLSWLGTLKNGISNGPATLVLRPEHVRWGHPTPPALVLGAMDRDLRIATVEFLGDRELIHFEWADGSRIVGMAAVGDAERLQTAPDDGHASVFCPASMVLVFKRQLPG